MMAAIAVYFLIFFRTSAPPTPPSIAATIPMSEVTQGMWPDTKKLLANKNFLGVFFCYFIIFGIYAGFGLIVSPLFANAGMTDVAMQALVCMMFLSAGIFACFTVGKWLDKHNKYLFALRSVIICTGVVLGLGIYLIPLGEFWAATLFGISAGLFMVPIVPVGFAFATEVTFPTSSALVIGLMTCTANLILFFLNSVYYKILSPIPPATVGTKFSDRVVLFILTAEVGLAIIGSIFIKEDLRRLNSGKLEVDPDLLKDEATPLTSDTTKASSK
jgi:MFS family permease